MPASAVDSAAHRQLALQVARESMVLLKNDGVLPLTKAPARIAVVGPLADSVRMLEGNYNGTPSRVTTIVDGIRQQFPSSQIVFEPGTGDSCASRCRCRHGVAQHRRRPAGPDAAVLRHADTAAARRC